MALNSESMQVALETVKEKLSGSFGDAIVEMTFTDMLTVTVKKENIYEVIQWLHDPKGMNFNFLTTMCGLHYPDLPQKFGMMYQLHNMMDNIRIRLKTFTNEENPEFVSLTSIWSAANWMEREAYDFFGFRFKGHPDLRRILNVDDMTGWPLRKEYPLEDQARFDKDDKMFGR